MLEKFPEVKTSQVVLSRADINTGIILDEHFKYATSSTQKIYTVFDNIDEASKYAHSIIKHKQDIECYIYDYKNDLLLLVDKNQV